MNYKYLFFELEKIDKIGVDDLTINHLVSLYRLSYLFTVGRENRLSRP